MSSAVGLYFAFSSLAVIVTGSDSKKKSSTLGKDDNKL